MKKALTASFVTVLALAMLLPVAGTVNARSVNSSHVLQGPMPPTPPGSGGHVYQGPMPPTPPGSGGH